MSLFSTKIANKIVYYSYQPTSIVYISYFKEPPQTIKVFSFQQQNNKKKYDGGQ